MAGAPRARPPGHQVPAHPPRQQDGTAVHLRCGRWRAARALCCPHLLPPALGSPGPRALPLLERSRQRRLPGRAGWPSLPTPRSPAQLHSPSPHTPPLPRGPPGAVQTQPGVRCACALSGPARLAAGHNGHVSPEGCWWPVGWRRAGTQCRDVPGRRVTARGYHEAGLRCPQAAPPLRPCPGGLRVTTSTESHSGPRGLTQALPVAVLGCLMPGGA